MTQKLLQLLQSSNGVVTELTATQYSYELLKHTHTEKNKKDNETTKASKVSKNEVDNMV